MSSLLVACDGSSRRSADGVVGQGPISWAWAREDGHWYANGDIIGTNQKAELIALMTVLLMHPKEHIHIQSDSRYALNVTEKWMWGWAKKGWRKSDGEEIINKEVIQYIHFLMTGRISKVDFEWVKGHDMSMSNPLNHKADELAAKTSENIKTLLTQKEPIPFFYSDSKGRTYNPVEHEALSPFMIHRPS